MRPMRRLIAKNLMLYAFFALSGCHLLPETKLPVIDEPSALRSGIQITPDGSDFSTYAWWEKLNDQQLNKLIAEALNNNHDIQIAMANVEHAEAQLRSARYAWLPTLDAQGGGIGAGGIDSTFTNKGNSNFAGGLGRLSVAYGGFVPSYTLNIFAVLNQTRVAEASLEIQRGIFNAVRLTIIGQVAGSYFNLLIARRELLLQEQKLAYLAQLKQAHQARFRAGASNASPLFESEKLLKQAQASLASVRDDIARTENAIQILTGKLPGGIDTKQNPLNLNTNGLIPGELPSGVLHQRPDLLIAENGLRVANAQIGIANAAFFPNISLTGILGGASVMLSNLFTAQGGFWAATAAVSMPVLNARKVAEVSAAEAKQKAAYANYLQTVKAVFSDVDNQLTGLQFANTRYTEYRLAKESAVKAKGIAQARFNVGATDIRNLLEAELSLTEAERSLNNSKSQQLSQLVTTLQSLAVGYAAPMANSR